MGAVRPITPGEYEVIVVGAGHAGCEAALAAARLGRRTLLLTMNLDLVAHMPCNPSIGGPAKGHLVREIDALGGEMARNADRTSIQIRMLNATRGPAVRAPRAQADKQLYALSMKHALEAAPNLLLKQGEVVALLTQGGRVAGVQLATGQRFAAPCVVLTTGTFLRGRVLSGDFATPAGRAGEFPAEGLACSLAELGLALGRLQTNTPPRVDARTIRYALTTPQFGSETPLWFSHDGPTLAPLVLPLNPVYPVAQQTAWRQQLPCYLVHTNAETHRIIRENLHRSPIAPGSDRATGPRYCPSIEDKVTRFAEKDAHSFFLEPEGYATGEVYVQGCFTGLPVEVQLELLRSIPALAEVEIVRPGYAIEYDYVRPHQLGATLELRALPGLFLAGQINGTSGYEEAAGQGLLAGANAALRARDEEPIVLRRDQGYLGVMVDDLVTRDHTEPYRLLTSRCEYRLLLRQDNADLRLTPLAYQVGLVSAERYEAVEARRRAIADEIARLQATSIPATPAVNALLAAQGLEPLSAAVSARQLLRRPEASYALVARLAPPPQPLAPEVAEQVEVAVQYEGYVDKQEQQVARARRLEDRRIPEGLDYTTLSGMRTEARERLSRYRPLTVGQASRLEGVNPADIAALLVQLEARGKRKAGAL